jgi:uncharacterized lipoprotein YajG
MHIRILNNTPMNTTCRLFLLAVSSAALVLTNGCALTRDTISLSYTPQGGVEKAEGAGAVKVKVEVADMRTIRDKVSCKKNGYGIECAAIVATEEVGETVRKAMETELTQRGFVMGNGSLLIRADLSRFYNDFKLGFWSGDANAEITMNLQLKTADG